MLDIHFFPSTHFFQHLLNQNPPLLDTTIFFQKGWYQNKTSIVGSNGVIHLSIPIEGGRNQKKILKDVKISYTQNWQYQHLKSIQSCYGNAPFFEYYLPIIASIYQKKFQFLLDLNIETIFSVISILKLENNIKITEDKTPENDVLFSKKNKESTILSNAKVIKYPQVFEDRLGFIPNLSIIDLLMCMGPQTRIMLR